MDTELDRLAGPPPPPLCRLLGEAKDLGLDRDSFTLSLEASFVKSLESPTMIGFNPDVFNAVFEGTVVLPEDGVTAAAAAAATAASDCDRMASKLRLDVVVPCLPKDPVVLQGRKRKERSGLLYF